MNCCTLVCDVVLFGTLSVVVLSTFLYKISHTSGIFRLQTLDHVCMCVFCAVNFELVSG